MTRFTGRPPPHPHRHSERWSVSVDRSLRLSHHHTPQTLSPAGAVPQVGLPIDTPEDNNLLDCCRKAGHWRRALLVFKRMLDDGVSPNTVTYDVLASAGAGARCTMH